MATVASGEKLQIFAIQTECTEITVSEF